MLGFIEKLRHPRPMRIILNGNPVLRKVSRPIVTITAEVKELAERMIVTMLTNEIVGVGLAAPQVGVNIRLIVIKTVSDSGRRERPDASPGELLLNPRMPLALVNPELLSVSDELVTEDEGCLSLPGVEGKVTRPAKILLRAVTLAGEELTVECAGLLARCLQHEIDHLNGRLFYDCLSLDEQKRNAAVMRGLERQESAFLAKSV